MLSKVEQVRRAASRASDPRAKARLGQFFTPSAIARFMAGLFVPRAGRVCRLLDPGAGVGSLSAAFLARWSKGDPSFQRIEVDAFEIDRSLHPYLSRTLAEYAERQNVAATIRDTDFVLAATERLGGDLFAERVPGYTHAILNPPYRKIRSDSQYRAALRSVGIETVNLYSAFVALSLCLLADQGQLVAIIPRSFCNGPANRGKRCGPPSVRRRARARP